MKGIIAIVVILAIYAGGLLWKGSIVDAKKAKHFPSVYEIHKENGVPIYTEKVSKDKFEQLITVTGKFDQGVFKASVTPQDRNKVSVGQKAIIEIGDEKTRYEGRVTKIASRSSLLTGLIEVEIFFASSSKLSGFQTADLAYNAKNNVLVVSRDSVNIRDEKPYVFIVNGDTITKSFVKIAEANALVYRISSGVKEGDEIVSSDTRNLTDGLKIKVVNELRKNL